MSATNGTHAATIARPPMRPLRLWGVKYAEVYATLDGGNAVRFQIEDGEYPRFVARVRQAVSRTLTPRGIEVTTHALRVAAGGVLVWLERRQGPRATLGQRLEALEARVAALEGRS